MPCFGALIAAQVLLVWQAPPEGGLFGLERRLEGLQEAATDYGTFLRPSGEIRAVMLFARFPDAEVEETTQSLYDRLVPGGIDYYRRASYGRMSLKVDAIHRWIPMDSASDSGDYDCSRFETHKHYLSETIAKADGDVDFSQYDIVYVAGSRNPGTPNSPTFLADPGDGISVDGVEVRHAVTFGNDVRQEHWGWQVLIHETGHVMGLPDLYEYGSSSFHRFVGGWDPMGFVASGCHYLAWHKAKLGWLDDDQVAVLREGEATCVLTPIESEGGLKAVVLPIGDEEAYVVEARTHEMDEAEEPGVLLYKVSTAVESGHGPIQVIPARPDDDNPKLRPLFATLYNALYAEGAVMRDAEHLASVEILRRLPDGIEIRASR